MCMSFKRKKRQRKSQVAEKAIEQLGVIEENPQTVFENVLPSVRAVTWGVEACSRVGEWQENGAFLQTDVLHIPGDKTLTRAEATRIYQYYLPVHYWIDGLLEAHRSASAAASSEGANAPPLFVGISCPQGGGKTTIVDSIAALFKRQGKSCAEVSIDDFYLTHADQQKVAAENPGNSLLQLRGNPGSHDMKLALDTLKELADANGKSGGGGGSVSVPRYDKSAFSGKGDRADPSTWPSLATPVDVVLMEGWCFGFKSLPATPGPSDERLALSNELLAGDYRSMHELMAAWVVVEVESPQVVYNWREQAEAAMRAAGKTAMTKEQVADFVDRYMPAYSHYLPSLYADGPDGAEGKPVLSFQIDNGRNPVSVADAVPFHFD